MYKLVLYTSDFKISEIVRGIEDYKLLEDGLKWNGESKGFTRIGRPFIVVKEDRDISTITFDETMKFLLPVYLERLVDECEQEIYKGFHSESMDAFFAFGPKDQDNFNQQLTLILLGDEDPIDWKTEDKGIIIMDKAQFVQLSKETKNHKRELIGKSWAIAQSVKNRVKTYQDLESIGSFAEEVEKLTEEDLKKLAETG